MKNTISSNPLKSKLWLALLVGAVSISACSNEVEEAPADTMEATETTTTESTDTMASTETMDSTELTPVETGQEAEATMTEPMTEEALDPSVGSEDSSINAEGAMADDTATMGESSTEVEPAPTTTAQ